MKDEIKVLENILFRLHCNSPISKKYGIELDKNECKLILDYITNLRTIEQQHSAVLSENAELKNKIFDLEDTLIDKKEYCYGLETQLTILQKENDRLNNIIDDLEQKNNLAENILYDYLYNDDKITKEKYEQFKGLKEGKQC